MRTPQQNRAHVADWKRRNPEKHAAAQKRYRSRHPGQVTRWRYANEYGGKPPYSPPSNCECCGAPFTAECKPTYDHCHWTLQFRGWLCNSCNSAIGLLGDSPEGVRKALAYIERAYERIRGSFSK